MVGFGAGMRGRVSISSSSVVDASPRVGLRSREESGRSSSLCVGFLKALLCVVWLLFAADDTESGCCEASKSPCKAVFASGRESPNPGVANVPLLSLCNIVTCSIFKARRSRPSCFSLAVPKNAVFLKEPLRFLVRLCWTTDAMAPPAAGGLAGLSSALSAKD